MEECVSSFRPQVPIPDEWRADQTAALEDTFVKPSRLLLLLAVCGLSLSPAAGDDPPKDEKKYAPMPWHLVDTWWDIGEDTSFESLAVDVTISDDVPSSVNLYIAPSASVT